MTKPRTIEELQQWVFDHANDGLINGQSPFESGTYEYRQGIVPGDLYDAALLMGAVLSLNKSQIVTHSFLLFLSSEAFTLIQKDLVQVDSFGEARSEFRGYVPVEIYKLIQNFQMTTGLTNSEVMTISLEIFTTNCALCRIYDAKLKPIELAYGLEREEIEQKIFDGWRLAARQKRLKQSLDAGVLISDRKLS
ncbi:MAG: hypothetical protein ABI417_11105 [Coleofasciculaceae cyanobacterium]